MVTIDRAVEIAQESLAKVMPSFSKLNPSVEEFRLSERGGEWLITFRAANPEPVERPHGMGSAFMPFIEKIVEAEVADGTLRSVRNPSFDF